MASAVLTLEELARAIVHKTVKCQGCNGAGVVRKEIKGCR